MPADRIDVTNRRFLAFWLLLAAAWFATGAIRPLLEPDEGRYSEIPREMLISGDWVTPRLNEIVYFEKPPLQYWGTAVAYKLFGLHELTARLWSLAFTLLALPLVYAVTRRLHASREAGLAATIALAVSPYYVLVGQLNTLDGAFTTLLVAAVFALVLGLRESDATRRRPFLLGAWAALAFAVLSKGIVAPLLAGGTMVAYSLAARDFSLWRRMHWLAGLALFAVIVVPWFWLVSARNPDFLYFFFVHEHFMRFLTTVHDRVEPWWFFGPIALLALLPWLRAIPATIRSLGISDAAPTGFRPSLFLGIWIVLVLVFFSLSGSKLATYVLPFMPAAAVLLGPQLLRHPRVVHTAAATSMVLVMIVGAGLCIAAFMRGAEQELLMQVAVWSGVAIMVTIAGWFGSRRTGDETPDPLNWAPIAIAALLAWQSLLMSATALPPLRTTKPLVADIRHLVRPETRVYSVEQYRQTIPWYLRRSMRLAAYRGELGFGIDRAGAGEIKTLEEFALAWQGETDSIAFMSVPAQSELVAAGLPGRVVASDRRTIVMVRQ